MKRLPRKRRRRPSPRGVPNVVFWCINRQKTVRFGTTWLTMKSPKRVSSLNSPISSTISSTITNRKPTDDSASPRRRLLAQRPSRADVRCTNNRIAHSVQTLKHLFIVLVTHTHLYFIQRLASGFRALPRDALSKSSRLSRSTRCLHIAPSSARASRDGAQVVRRHVRVLARVADQAQGVARTARVAGGVARA